MNSSESSNNTTKMNTSASFDELKTNKLYKPSQFKVTMNSNKVDFLTNASTTTNKSNSNSITDIINRRRRNNKSLFKKFQKTNETTISNVSNESGSLHIHEKINSNNITEITIIDDITNSSDVEIDVINSTKNFNTIDDDIINIVDDINALTNNKINNNMKPSNNDVNNDTDTLNANNNNIIDNDTPNTTDLDKSNSQTELFSPILAGNDDDDDVLPDAQSVLTINLSNNEQSHQHPASESQSSDKSVTIMSTTNCNNNKIKTLDSFFTKSISFSEYEKSIFSTSSSSLDKRENKTTNNKSNNNATKNNSSKNKTSSIPTNTISNYFISTNRKKQPTTPKFNKQHSYPTVTNQSNEDKMDNQFVNLRKLFNFSNNPEKVTSSSIEIKDSTLDHNNNENSSNDKPKTSNEIIIDDIQDSDIEEDPDEVKSVKDNKSIPESMEPEVGTNSTVTNEMATPSSLSEDGPNTKNLTKNESEVSSHQNAAKNKFKALLNRNNILLRKSASVSKTSTYFFKSSSSQNEENEKETSSSGTTESSNPQKGNMLVDEPTPLYISDSENENENDTINSDDDENESDKNNNSSSLNIFSSFIKSDNEDDILSEIDDNDLNKNNNDNNNDSNILSSSTIIPSSGYSLSNDDHTKINNNDDDDSSINFNATTNNTNPDSPSINISQMFDSFHTNNLKRKRDKYSTTPEDKNFFTEANKQETKEDSQSTVVASQNSTPPKEEVKVNDSHKNISLLLKQRFSYAKGVDSNSDSASQILTKVKL